jgi:hypothetical protein
MVAYGLPAHHRLSEAAPTLSEDSDARSAAMDGKLIPFPHTNGSYGSPHVRVVPYPARARVIVEHDDHTLDAWDQMVRLVPRVQGLVDVILSLGILLDERDQTSPDEWIDSYWRLVEDLIRTRQRIDIAALKRDYDPGALPIPRYDDKLTDEIEVAQQDLDWLIPVLDEIAATVDQIQRYLREHRRHDAAEAVGELIGVIDLAEARLNFAELFRLWRSYRLDAHGNLIDDDGQVYAHISEFEDSEDDS